ncbi:MAG: hypothetical protein BAJALOKI3v1_1070007 [Promethearchaeota archaeon]|jgi:hypothetical protein|nr:MAG: hypothetical protein BAJALOKI3v1_1070007 [Candidatus Lokiarchaeota archaeon]
MVSSEEAEAIATEYLKKNGHTECSLDKNEDKIVKWLVTFSGGGKVYRVQVSKSDGSVLGFTVD